MIVNEGSRFAGYILVEGPYIKKVGRMEDLPEDLPFASALKGSIDCGGHMLMPGIIDTHVHFREPGLTDRADIASESLAAVLGGVTSYCDMPNTVPQTTTRQRVEEKAAIAARTSRANHAFFIGATADNLQELLEADYSRIPGIKLFLGSSTGGMLVDGDDELDAIFAACGDNGPLRGVVIAVHAEDEGIIAANRAAVVAECGGDPAAVPVERHPDIRSRQACVAATARALRLAEKHGAHLHVCHVSTADELQLIADAKARGVKVTAETCPQYLLFDRNDFLAKGARIKCNPAVKEASDRIALVRALLPGGAIDTIATDHAPHLLQAKEGGALTAASGMPMVQFSLQALLELMATDPAAEGLTEERLVELMCHNPARVFGISRRGFIREGCYADFCVVATDASSPVSDTSAASRCGWTPLSGMTLKGEVLLTMVDGKVVKHHDKLFPNHPLPLVFVREQ